MKILITGSNGFVGKNLISELRNNGYTDLYLYDRETPREHLNEWSKDCDFVYHLAGVNRPEDESEFMEGNYGLTLELLDLLKENNNKAPIMLSSSIQAELDNPYGKSKKAGEDLLFQYAEDEDVKVYVYRFSNLYGKWTRPNYNTVVATFCYNIAHGLPITVNNPNQEITFQYIDDVTTELISLLTGKGTQQDKFYICPVEDSTTIGELAQTIRSFADMRNNLFIPDMSDRLTKNLYSVYTSFLPENDFSYDLKMNIDERGSFTEIFKTDERGQFSVNVVKPGITKGQHWHSSKLEKYIVVQGTGLTRLRKYGTNEIIEYETTGDNIQVVDIPAGYVHSLVNVGADDMICIIWANEVFDPENPDTHYEEV